MIKTDLSPVIVSRLEKVAIDNGFDRELPAAGDWLGFASTQCPLQIWLSVSESKTYLAAISQSSVVAALPNCRMGVGLLPQGAVACLVVADVPTLHHLVRRAFQLSKTLPDEPLHIFERQTRLLPKTTEADRLVAQRIGQDIFRDALIDYWAGACAVTGIALKPVLRASHMKPWSRCDSDAERLNVFNGILLVANLDALFDRGLISFEDSGRILIGADVSAECCEQLNLHPSMHLRWVANEHFEYLQWHREWLYEDARA